MNQDAKDFIKLAALSFAPFVLFFGVLFLIAVMYGCKAKNVLGYVIEDQNGTQFVCKHYYLDDCGVEAWDCEDGILRQCMHNVKIRKVEP
jgi:hypothetical protein